jgi:hypothetical protein
MDKNISKMLNTLLTSHKMPGTPITWNLLFPLIHNNLLSITSTIHSIQEAMLVSGYRLQVIIEERQKIKSWVFEFYDFYQNIYFFKRAKTNWWGALAGFFILCPFFIKTQIT